MLPKSRVISALLLGVGVAGVSAGVAAPSFLSADPTLPLNLPALTWTITDDSATTRLYTDGRQLTVPVTAQWHLTVQSPADATSATVRVGSSWLRGSQQQEAERLIDAQVWTYPMDRLSGAPLGPGTLTHTLGSPTAEVPMEGSWWKFPADAEKTTYDVFDDTLRRAAPAVFEEEVERNGHTLYRYHQEIPATNVAKLHPGTFTTAKIDDATTYLYHSATRDFYVDPHSGLVVDLDISVKDFYGDNAGAERANALEFDGSISDADTETLLQATEEFRNSKVLRAVRWGLIGSGTLVALVALAGVFGAFTRKA